MDCFPDEILLLIAELLSRSHRPSLISFSLSGGRYRRISRNILFREVNILPEWNERADWDEQTGPKLRECFNMLQSSDAFALVQTLELRPALDGDEPMLWEKFIYPERLALTNNVYELLAKLLMHLTNLTDFHFGFHTSRSDLLYRLLSTCAPTCKVHLASLRFETLHRDPGKVDPCELAIASWHNLHSFKAEYGRFQGGHVDYTHEAALEMIAGHAPNLQDVALFLRPKDHPLLEIPPVHSDKPWTGFPDTTRDNGKRGQLESLQYFRLYVEASDIQELANYVDFPVLRQLDIGLHISTGAIQHLNEANLCCLRSLSISLLKDDPEYIISVNSLLSNLSPLRSLEIRGGVVSSTLERISKFHGATLCTLMCAGYPSLSLFEIRQLAVSCKRLESLELSMKRSLGNANEIAAYQALGSISRLQCLTIELDASKVAATTPEEQGLDPVQEIPDYFDEFDRKAFEMNAGGPIDVRNGHMREALINSAVDQVLALQIFRTIESAKPSESLKIERISVKSVGGGSFGQRSSDMHTSEMFAQVSCSWQVSRSIRDDQRDKLVIEQLQDRATPYRLNCSPQLRYDLEPIFRRVWPSKFSEDGEESDWRSDWHSMPLSSYLEADCTWAETS